MSLSWPALSPRRISHRRGPTKKTPGTVNHRVDIAGGTAGNDGQWRNMCRHWELNPSYQWQARVSAEAHNRWHLTPVNSRSADIPLVSASLPIRIDCSTALLIHGVIAESSSSLTLIMSCIDLTTAVCYSEAISSPCSQLMPWCYRSYTGNTCKYGQKYGVHPGRASESEEVFLPLYLAGHQEEGPCHWVWSCSKFLPVKRSFLQPLSGVRLVNWLETSLNVNFKLE